MTEIGTGLGPQWRNDDVAAVLAFPNALDAGECAELVALAERLPDAAVGVYPPRGFPSRQATTKVLDLPDSHWLMKRLGAFACRANSRFGLAVGPVFSPVMICFYDLGGHFEWHTDLGEGAESTRKISISVAISPPEGHEGGELQVLSLGKMLPSELGTLIAFPSHLTHRVTPITKGRRAALVSWLHGPPFR